MPYAGQFTLVFDNIGDGATLGSRPTSQAVPRGQLIVSPSPNVIASNLYLNNGVAIARPLARFFQTSQPVYDQTPLGIYYANQFAKVLIGQTPNTEMIFWDDSGPPQWKGADIDAGDIPAGGLSPAVSPFSFVEAPLSGGGHAVFFSTQDQDGIAQGATTTRPIGYWNFDGADNERWYPVSSTVVHSARKLLYDNGRLFALNAYDTVGDQMLHRGIFYSVVGDPTDFAGTGSGIVELAEDPSQIIDGVLSHGRIVVYKGGPPAGALSISGVYDEQFSPGATYVGTPTGAVNAPYRWDKVADFGVSHFGGAISLPGGSILMVTLSGLYLHDGARGFVHVPSYLDDGPISQDPHTSIYSHVSKARNVAVFGTHGQPSHIFDIKTRRLYKSYSYIVANSTPPNNPTFMTNYTDRGGVEGTLGALWLTEEEDVCSETGNGTGSENHPVVSWVSPAFVPDGQQITIGQGRRTLEPTDMVTVRQLHVRSASTGQWFLRGYVTALDDSGAKVSTSFVAVIKATSGALKTTTIHIDPITSNWFQFTLDSYGIVGGNPENYNVHSLLVDFTYAGAKNAADL